MAVLSFKVQADYEKVVRLREEIAKLEAQMRSFGRNTPLNEIKAVESKLADAKSQFTAITTEAAKAGATIDSGFKAKIYSASQAVNDLTAKIIEQKSVVKNVEFDVKRLGEAYRIALKSGSGGRASEMKAEYDAAKKALQEEKAALFGLTQEKATATLATKRLKDEYNAFKKEAGEAVKTNEGFTVSLGKVAGLVGGAAALKQLASQIVSVRGQFQDMETAIETLVGKDMANKLMPQIKEMAKISPLTMTDIVGAEKMMLGFNIEAEKTIDYLKAISDISMGNSQKFNSLTLAFSQMSAAGRLMGQDLNQMINAGFNPLQVISEKTGKSIAQLKEEMSKGAISAEMVQQAFLDATSAGGKFYNMSENASKTINGQISMMQDAMDAAFNEIGTKTEGIIIKSIKAATSLIQNYEKIGKVLVGLVTTYGAYRTAVFLATAATSKHTIAEIALTNVRIAARKAQMALNAAMLTNPYVALATVVAGLTATIVLNADAMSANAMAYKKYNERVEAANELEEDRRKKVSDNLSLALDEAEASGKRVEALEYLASKYPTIFAEYDLEKLKLTDIIALKKEIAEIDRQAEIKSKKERLDELDKEVEKASKRANTTGGGLLGKAANAANKKGYDDIVKARDELREEVIQDAIADYIAQLPEEQKELNKLKEEIQDKIDNSGEFLLEGFALSESHLTKINSAIVKKIKTPSYGVDYEAAKEEWETAKKELDKIEKDKDIYTSKQYEAAKTRVETAEKNFKKLGGDTTGKKDKNAVQKANEDLDRQEKQKIQAQKNAVEMARSEKDMEFMVEQARIDAMREGSDKVRAQRKLDNKKELDALDRQKQDYITKVVERERAVFEAQEEAKAKNDAKYKKQAFDEEAVRANVDTKAYDDARALTEKKQKAQEDEYLKTLLEQYKSYEDKKQELVISYLNDTDELQAMYEETGDERYKRSLDERHNAYVKAMNALESEFNTADFQLVFGDPSKMTKATIEKALGVARKKLADLDKEADLETFQALSEAIERLENARDSNPFEGWGTSVMDVLRTMNKIRNLNKDIEEYKKQGNTKAQEAAEAQLEKSKSDMKNALIGTGATEFANSLTQAADAMREIAETSGDVQLAGMAEQMGAWAQNLSAAAQGAASGGWIGAIVGGVSDIISQTVEFFVSSKVSAEQTSKEIEDFRHQIEMLQYVVDEADFSNIFGTDELEYSKDALNKAKEALADYESMMAELNSNTMTTLYEKEEQFKSLGAAIMLGQWGIGMQKVISNEFKGALEAYEKGYSQLEAMQVKTKDVNGWGNFFGFQDEYTALKDLAPELWGEDGVFNVEAAKLFLETNTQLNEEQRKQIQNIIDLKDAYDEANQAVEQYLEDLFGDWGESLGSIISDSVLNGIDAWDEFGKKGSEVIKQLGRQAIYATFFEDTLDDYIEPLKEAVGDPDKMASLTASLMDELKGNFEAAQSWLTEYYNQAESMGFDMYGDSTSGQSASSKGYQTLSEDTGNDLVGRATAQYESNLRMEESMRTVKDSVDIMTGNQVQIRDIAAESRALIADSYLELQQIRENTGDSAKLLKAIDARMTEWDSKIKSI